MVKSMRWGFVFGSSNHYSYYSLPVTLKKINCNTMGKEGFWKIFLFAALLPNKKQETINNMNRLPRPIAVNPPLSPSFTHAPPPPPEGARALTCPIAANRRPRPHFGYSPAVIRSEYLRRRFCTFEAPNASPALKYERKENRGRERDMHWSLPVRLPI